MNCFVGCECRLWVATIVFYTCVLIPLRQLRRAVARVLICDSERGKEMEFPEFPSLPVSRYEDLRDGHRQEICSICLVEYEGPDAVSIIGTCCHVFHLNCIHQWILRNQFSCPLCRSLLFSHHYSKSFSFF
ncbi:hypothetical protein VNO78_18825 [Psophocarpus tetragonolobus]|uniref:RING-type domain-containing protein n=1 Tax=Psophocarpus tetragonolobus TaxID=3891 RepID=A0AAN9SBA8_PSOTE